MESSKAKLLELFEHKDVGEILSRQEVEELLGVSSRTVDNLVASLKAEPDSEIRVVTVTSFIKTKRDVQGSAPQPCVDSATTSREDCGDYANTSEEDCGDYANTKGGEPLKGATPKAPAPLTAESSSLSPDYRLPPGCRVVFHKYQGRVVVNSQGQIDTLETSKMMVAEAGVDKQLLDSVTVTPEEPSRPVAPEADF